MTARQRVTVNFFRPVHRNMRNETAVIKTILLFWAFLSFGVPLIIWLAGLGDPQGLGESFFTRWRFLGFPLHYWLVAQGCTIGYVLLCKLYCLLWERRVAQQRIAPPPLRRG